MPEGDYPGMAFRTRRRLGARLSRVVTVCIYMQVPVPILQSWGEDEVYSFCCGDAPDCSVESAVERMTESVARDRPDGWVPNKKHVARVRRYAKVERV